MKNCGNSLSNKTYKTIIIDTFKRQLIVPQYEVKSSIAWLQSGGFWCQYREFPPEKKYEKKQSWNVKRQQAQWQSGIETVASINNVSKIQSEKNIQKYDWYLLRTSLPFDSSITFDILW